METSNDARFSGRHTFDVSKQDADVTFFLNGSLSDWDGAFGTAVTPNLSPHFWCVA